VLDDAANKGDFINDPYIRREKTRSLLCAPLLSLGRLIGILYLENNLTSHAFTAERIQLLEMLLSQAAISLENARIYQALKDSAKKLRENEDRMQLALKGANIGFFDFNIANNILIIDDGWLGILGYKPGEIKMDTDTWWSWVHPDDQPKQAKAFMEHLEGRTPYYHVEEYRARSKSGDWVWILDHGKLVEWDADGKPLRLVGIHLNITERKLAEEKLRQYQDQLEETVEQRTAELLLARDEANAANKAKSDFLANMSHELRTPLNAILGFSAMMRREPELTEGQCEKLDIINRSGNHLLTLINDVLEIARIEAGRVQLENSPFDLGAMVRDVTDMMRIRAEDGGLQLLVDQASRFPRYIVGDEARLRQILINLMGNAIKHTQEGGVTLRLGTKKNKATHLLIEVEDSGVGIAPEDQERIFEPFVQLSEHGISKGTGLGLTITRQFVQMMNGNINLESIPGTGSIFRVDLPLNEARESDITQQLQAEMRDVTGLAMGQPKYRILIVEDQKENQLLLYKLLESVGFQVKIAEDGAQGVTLFQSWHPHFIWMDRRMPVLDGVEATRRIRELPGGKEVKIVAVTASAFAEQCNEMLAAGMDDYVRKPFRASEIYDSLAKHLGVKYLYKDVSMAQEQDTSLTPEMLSGLPEALLGELKEALESLDAERIEAVIQKVAKHDQTLQGKLIHFTENFDYPSILRALGEWDRF
jgi:PAS domain S-box-containing protein